MGGNVVKALAFAFDGFAVNPFRYFGIEIFVLLKPVIAKTLSFGTNHLTFDSFGVLPAEVQAILRFF